MPTERPKQSLALLILDGWGIAPSGPGNPLKVADTPNINRLIRDYPTMTLRTSGEAVGLSWGEQGNSEVGHLTIGAGRVYYQSFPRINLAIQSGEFFRNPAFMAAADRAAKGGAFHIIGILSSGNVHGAEQHIHALLDFARRRRLRKVFVHVILDGRDAIYNSGIDFVRALEKKMRSSRVGRIASVGGRSFAMDRDNRWDRTAAAYRAMAGRGPMAEDAISAIASSYSAQKYDEELEPVTIAASGSPIGPIADGDAVVFANFRAERARQLASALGQPAFDAFDRGPRPDITLVTMTEYEKDLPAQVAFPAEVIQTCLGKIIADTGRSQLHVAETEKYAHVTFFLNGMREEPFEREERVIIPSLKVESFAQVPEMSAQAITDRVVQAITERSHDFVVANFANTDMVGHTGDFAATKRAAEFVDACIGRVAEAAAKGGFDLVITADHGNGEDVINLRTHDIDKEHNANPAPLIIIGKRWAGVVPPSGEYVYDGVIGGDLSVLSPVGMLADVAPTILRLMDIPQPKEMTGNSLL